MAELQLKPKSKKAKPKLTSDQSQSLWSQAKGVGLSALHRVGSLLDFPDRLIYGSLNAASGLPGGFGSLNPIDNTNGITSSKFAENLGVYPKNDPNHWEWADAGRLAIDILGSPMSYTGFGGLTKTGQSAAQAGKLAAGRLNQIRQGERAMVNLRLPLGTKSYGHLGTGAATADALETAMQGTGADRAASAISQSPPAVWLKQKFHASAMGRSTHATQQAAKEAYNRGGRLMNQVDLATVNAGRNRELAGRTAGDVERGLIEAANPSDQMIRPVVMKDWLHGLAQRAGIKTGDLENKVKAFSRVGEKKASRTIFLDDAGNVARIQINHGVKNPTAPFNFMVPNTPTQHFPRYAGENVHFGLGKGEGFGKEVLSASASMDQHRNRELFGGAATNLIEQGIRSTGGIQPRLAQAGIDANQQARILGKAFEKAVKRGDLAAGTDLTGRYVSDGLRHQRTREMGQFLQQNPQLSRTGLFTNDPLSDFHTYGTSLADRIAKAESSTSLMARLGRLSHGETEAIFKRHNLDHAPTIRDASAELGLQHPVVSENVYRQLPAVSRAQVDQTAAQEAFRTALHEMRQGTLAVTQLRGRVQQLIPNIRERLVLDLELPSREYKSLVGFKESVPKTETPGLLQSAITAWKANMLAHPATQVRNVVSAHVNNALEGVGIKPTVDSAKLLLGNDISGYSHHPDVAKLMRRQKVDETEALRRLAGVHMPPGHSIVNDLPPNQIGTSLQDVTASASGTHKRSLLEALGIPFQRLAGFNPQGEHVGVQAINPLAINKAFGHDQTKYSLAMAANAAAHGGEQSARLAGFLHHLRRGEGTAEDVARRISSAQVNYGPREFSEFEKNHIKPYIPFYAFGSRSLNHVVHELATNPGGRMAAMVRASDEGSAKDPSLPDELTAGTAIPYPFGQPSDGTKRFITGFGLMHEQPVRMLGSAVSGDLRGLGYEALGMLNPLFRVPIEQTLGRSAYQRGEEIQNADPVLGRLASNLMVNAGMRDENAGPLKYTGSPYVEGALSMSPVSRLASTARTLTDTRKGLPEKVFNTLTGMRVKDVSPKRQEATLMKRAEQLAVEAGARSRKDVYFSKAELEKLDKSDPQLAARQRQLQLLLNEVKAKAKAGAAGKGGLRPKKRVHQPQGKLIRRPGRSSRGRSMAGLRLKRRKKER